MAFARSIGSIDRDPAPASAGLSFRWKAVLAVLFALALAGFGLTAWTLPDAGVAIRFKAWQGPQAGAVVPKTQIANTQAEWQDLWSSLRRDPAPSFDPERQTGVAILLGQRPTPGYRIGVIGTEQRGDRLVIVVEETHPTAKAAPPPVVTSPFTIMLIERSAANVSVEKRVRD
ncbi:MAG TPA: protease complex subunit PrcB family protein [Vineibacter sp.]|nr:protease complex subunit PrcB family protein [Vineibacter sp.]